MSIAAWIVTGVLLGLLSPVIALAVLARAAWAALRERMAMHA